MTFRLLDLSPELFIDIIRLASTPELLEKSTESKEQYFYYQNAVSLSYVSYTFRKTAMISLLETVVLQDPKGHLAFGKALALQRNLRQRQSQLAIDYSHHIKRFWSTFCYTTIPSRMDEDSERLDLELFGEVLRKVHTLGFHSNSLPLLYECLAIENAKKWECRRIVFAGVSRWNPLLQTGEGVKFLQALTHIALWFPISSSEEQRDRWPEEVRNLPFERCESMSHFACTLAVPRGQKENLPTRIVAMTTKRCNESVMSIRELLDDRKICLADIGAETSFASQLKGEVSEEGLWEGAFMEWEPERAWKSVMSKDPKSIITPDCPIDI